MIRIEQKIYQHQGNSAVIQLVPRNAKKILDVGCGAGSNAAVLSAKGCIVDGVTLSEEEGVIAQKFCRNVYIHNLENGLPTEIDENYDACICSHVLEHICWPEILLTEIREILLCEKGTLVVALPNLFNYRDRLKLLMGRFEYSENGGIWDNTHFRWYTFESAQRLLVQNGFTITSAYAEGGFPFWKLRKILPKFTVLIDRLSCKYSPGLFGFQLIIVAHPSL